MKDEYYANQQKKKLLKEKKKTEIEFNEWKKNVIKVIMTEKSSLINESFFNNLQMSNLFFSFFFIVFFKSFFDYILNFLCNILILRRFVFTDFYHKRLMFFILKQFL